MGSVGTLWSAVARVRSGRRTVLVETKAVEGLGARDFVHEVKVDVEQGRLASGEATTCSSQIFSKSVRAAMV